MPQTTRARNLDLYRKLHGGHAFTSKRLKGVTNSAYLSEMATGDRPITDTTAREIEDVLKLPTGWLDQDNASMIYLSASNFALHTAIEALEVEVRSTLHDLVGHLTRPRR